MRHGKRLRVLVVLLAMEFVAACGSTTEHAAVKPGRNTRQSTTVPTTAPQSSMTSSSTATSSPVVTSSTTATSSSTATTVAQSGTCATADLSASVRTLGAGGGTQEVTLTLTNHGKAPCSTGGFPGVSFLSAQRAAIGAPAQRTTGAGPSPTLITLTPGQSASSTVTASPAACNGGMPPTSTYMQVFPPNQTTPVIVPAQVSVCNNTVAALQPGTTSSYVP